MSEAPKKILYHKKKHVFGWETEETISYIREDVVLELVEALKELVDLIDNDYEMDSLTTQPSRAAIAKLEESHE